MSFCIRDGYVHVHHHYRALVLCAVNDKDNWLLCISLHATSNGTRQMQPWVCSRSNEPFWTGRGTGAGGTQPLPLQNCDPMMEPVAVGASYGQIPVGSSEGKEGQRRHVIVDLLAVCGTATS